MPVLEMPVTLTDLEAICHTASVRRSRNDNNTREGLITTKIAAYSQFWQIVAASQCHCMVLQAPNCSVGTTGRVSGGSKLSMAHPRKPTIAQELWVSHNERSFSRGRRIQRFPVTCPTPSGQIR
jgi:hypothetical protein